jgi:hypothetical protein
MSEDTAPEVRSLYIQDPIPPQRTWDAGLPGPLLKELGDTVALLEPALTEWFGRDHVPSIVAELHTLAVDQPRLWHLIRRLAAQQDFLDSNAAAERTQKRQLDARSVTEYLEHSVPEREWYVEADYAPSASGPDEGRLYITISRERSAGTLASFRSRDVGDKQPVYITVEPGPPYFEVASGRQLLPSGFSRSERVSVVFTLRPLAEEGVAVIRCKLWLPDRTEPVSAEKPIKISPDTPDLIMRVFIQDEQLHYSLRFASDLSDQKLTSITLKKKPADYFSRLHKYLGKLAASTPSSNPLHVRRDLEEIGMRFYAELFPQELQSLFWEKIYGRVSSWQILVDTEASQIPWELIVPTGGNSTGQAHQFLCESFQIGRWFAERDEGVPPLKRRIKISPLALVAYDAGLLDGVVREAELLRQLFAGELKEVRPVHSEVENLLSSETMLECSGLHLSGDGRYDDGVDGCIFRLSDTALTETNLFRPENRRFGSVTPLVFLNFCESGLAGHSLTGFLGWTRLMRSIGASCVIATMWKANDRVAPDFSHRVYSELLKGSTVGEAMQAGRKEILNAGDATWLAYVLYGDPRARAVLAPPYDERIMTSLEQQTL